jgi:ferredoxin-NADP reductase
MAVSKRARIVHASSPGPQCRILQLEADDDLGFRGGQYVIVQTGVAIGDGKTAKRAYSILSSDAEQRSFELAVRRIENGPGSNYMASLAVGAELSFSGPWGKFFVAEDTAPQSIGVVATDTGITAALGVAASSQMASHGHRVPLIWLISGDQYFLPESEVHARVARTAADLKVFRVPTEQTSRKSWWDTQGAAVIEHVRSCRLGKVFLSGDGNLLARMRDVLQACDTPPELTMETFFHHQAVKQLA